MLAVYEAFRNTRGDAVVIGVQAIVIEGALASIATLYAVIQLNLACLLIVSK